MPQRLKKVVFWICGLCEYEWSSADGQKPIRCAKCKSPYWDRPRKTKTDTR